MSIEERIEERIGELETILLQMGYVDPDDREYFEYVTVENVIRELKELLE